MSDEERKKLNLKAGRLINNLNIPIAVTENNFDVLRDSGVVGESGFAGYAHYYLNACWNESELKNKADIEIYKQVLDIDAKLGTSQSEQLFECVTCSVRIDLIKV